MGYQLLIVKHSRKFRYPSWLHYDIEFRKWAANNNHRRWSQLNQEIYALAFSGQGVATVWCALCQIEGRSHTVDCPNFSSPVKHPFLGSQSPPNNTQSEPVKKRRKVPPYSTGISAATVDKSTLPRIALRRASSQLGKGAFLLMAT